MTDSHSAIWEDETVTRWWQDQFTDGVDPEYTEQIIPIILDMVGQAQSQFGLAKDIRILDIGTGEGQIARALAPQVGSVVGLDLSESQLVEAGRRGGPISYVCGSADSLPLDDQSFDVVVACLVFEHIDAVDAALAEVARVLRPGGRFLLLLNHPLLQTPNSGWIDDQMIDPPEQYWRVGSYLTETSTLEEVEKDIFIRFVHRPLSRYLNAMADLGLRLVHMMEPEPPPGFVARAPEYTNVTDIPRLLVLVVEHTAHDR